MQETPTSIWGETEPLLEFSGNTGWLAQVFGEHLPSWSGGITAVLDYLRERPAMAVMDKYQGSGAMMGLMADEVVEAVIATNDIEKGMEWGDVMVFGILTGALFWQELNWIQKKLVVGVMSVAALRMETLAGGVVRANELLINVVDKDKGNYPALEFQSLPDMPIDQFVKAVGVRIHNLHTQRELLNVDPVVED